MKNFLFFCTLIVGLGLAPKAWSKTNIYFQNRTGFKINFSTSVAGSKLSSKAYGIVNAGLAAGDTKKIMWFNRDSGIKNGKTYQILTQISAGDTKIPLQMDLLWRLKGRSIGSYLNHGFIVEGVFKEWGVKQRGAYLSRIIGDNILRLTVHDSGRGIHDDLTYVLESFKMPEVSEDGSFKAMFYNIYMRPMFLFKNGQYQRAALIPQALKGRDILGFAEAFDNEIRGLVRLGLRRNYPFQTGVVGLDRGLEQDGGVFIASRLPILEEDEVLFGKVCARVLEDCLADKGVKYAKIWNGKKIIHVFATHLQNGEDRKDKMVKRKQVDILGKFIQKKVAPDSDELVLVLGDFNIDLRDDPDAFTRIGLRTQIPTERPLSYDPAYNQLAEGTVASQIDYILYSENHSIPTNFNFSVTKLESKRHWRFRDFIKVYHDLSDHFPVEAEISF